MQYQNRKISIFDGKNIFFFQEKIEFPIFFRDFYKKKNWFLQFFSGAQKP